MSLPTENAETAAAATAPATGPPPPPPVAVALKTESKGDAAPAAAPKPVAKKIDDRDKQSSGGHGVGIDDLRVKPEFVLQARAESLGPIKAVAEESGGGGRNGSGGGDDRDNNNRGGDDRDNPRNKKKRRKRGQNKKRPRDAREDAADKMCMAVLRGEECPFGDTCRFSHDLKGYMATRPTDICELADAMGGGCPIFKSKGYCFYGAICRLGSSHITKAGENLRNDEVMAEQKKLNGGEELTVNSGNILSRDVVFQLRKNKYPFECKRYFEKSEATKSTKEENATTTPKSTAIDPPITTEKKDEKDLNSPVILAAESSPATTPAPPITTNPSSPTPLDKLKTRKIIDFSNKIYVAPLTTVGNLPFRRIMKQFGADITCGEMAVATNLLEGKPSEWALLKRHKSEDIFGIQLAAAHPDQFTRISELVEKYTDVDFVDMNLGCPLDLLCNKGAGAALMMREKKLKGALEGMSRNLTCSITVKMRTGWNIHKPFAHELVPKIQSWNTGGIAAIMVRTRSTNNSEMGRLIFHFTL